MSDTALQVVTAQAVQAAVEFDKSQVELIKRTLMDPEATMEELSLFITFCKRTGLDPIAKQIYAIHRYDKRKGGKVMSIQTSIDGFRIIAERHGKYAGQVGPFWCGSDGEWKDIWLGNGKPVAAKVGILRHDFKEPLWGIAKWSSYAQERSPMWKNMPEHMLAKCAESLALRRAFPNDLSGIYTREEMHQAEEATYEVVQEPSKGDQSRQLYAVEETPVVAKSTPRTRPAGDGAASEPEAAQGKPEPFTYVRLNERLIKAGFANNDGGRRLKCAFASSCIGGYYGDSDHTIEALAVLKDNEAEWANVILNRLARKSMQGFSLKDFFVFIRDMKPDMSNEQGYSKTMDDYKAMLAATSNG
ncbi:MAG: phage recombination protein Bet [Bacteroidota bacterium]